MRTHRDYSRSYGLGILILAPLFLGDAAIAQELSHRGTLRVLVMRPTEDRRFFDIRPTGALGGFDYEILEGFARLQRLRIEAVQVESWGELVPALLQRQGDIIAGGYTASEGRRKQIDFTEEVFPTRTVVATRRTRLPVLGLQQLRKAKVGTLQGSPMVEQLRKAGVPAAQIALFPTIMSLDEALRADRIEASVEPIESVLSPSRFTELKLGMYLGEPESLAFGFRKDDSELRAALSAYLSNTRLSGAWSRLIVKYFGTEALAILKRARESNDTSQGETAKR